MEELGKKGAIFGSETLLKHYFQPLREFPNSGPKISNRGQKIEKIGVRNWHFFGHFLGVKIVTFWGQNRWSQIGGKNWSQIGGKFGRKKVRFDTDFFAKICHIFDPFSDPFWTFFGPFFRLFMLPFKYQTFHYSCIFLDPEPDLGFKGIPSWIWGRFWDRDTLF
jgi:hypothetical protein